MAKELNLILSLINIWWDSFCSPSPTHDEIITFTHYLAAVLVKNEVEELDIIYNPQLDKWVIREVEER